MDLQQKFRRKIAHNVASSCHPAPDPSMHSPTSRLSPSTMTAEIKHVKFSEHNPKNADESAYGCTATLGD